MAKFEGVQKEILESTSNNQLVSAGAGSGKTTVMIQKIADLLLKEKVPVENMLVVTFTVLAATEMKDRLLEKMKEEILNCEDKTYVLDLIEKIQTASIDTIDGFSSKTIKKYFYNLEISPNVEIVSDSTKDYYLTKAMKSTMDSFAKQSDKMNLMLDLFGGRARNTALLEDAIISTFYNVISLEDYENFFDLSIKEYVESEKCEDVVNSYICSNVNRIKRRLMYNYTQDDDNLRNVIQENLFRLENINSALSLKANLTALEDVKLIEFAKKDIAGCSDLLLLNSEIKSFNKFVIQLKEDGIDKDFDLKNEKILEIFKIFINLVRDFIKNYNILKEKNNLIDFNDLNRLMLKLLANEEVRKELQNKYKYIFVDEYQDVNPLQDGLISKIIGDDTKLFLVGDVKQSIYGFRGASPEWFLNKYNNYKQNGSLGRAFDMNVNFRSSPNVLQFINQIFSKLMTKEQTDINYLQDCLIEPKRDDIVDQKVKMILVNNAKEKEVAKGVYSVKNHVHKEVMNDAKKEAILVSQIITDLIGSEIYDAKQKERRKLRYSDIAILSRSEKDESAKILIEQLKSVAIPLSLTNKLEIKENECIKLILSILKCVVGIADDVDYVASFFALTDFDIDELISIRNKEESLYENLINNQNNQYIADGFEILNDIRNKSYVSTNAELIRYILDAKKVRYFLLRKKEGKKAIVLLEEFISKLSATENNLSLAEFVTMIESNVSNGGDFSSSDNQDCVTFQTIHKSKGLEYPVVILYGASKQFQYITEHDGINFNADIGLGIDYFDITNRTKSYSVPKYAIKLKNSEKGYKEELRLLYVALTRAKNKLYITGNYNSKIFEERSVSKTSYMNMLLSCFVDRIEYGHNDFEFCEIDFVDNLVAKDVDLEDECSSVDIRYIDFVYSGSEKFGIPFKNTVTALNSNHAEKSKFETKEWLSSAVQYHVEEDRAIIGTHYHKALEMLDFFNAYEKNTDFEDVDYSKVEKAHANISKLVKGAKQVRKEAEFMMYVPYNEIVQGGIEDKVLIQGVVDLIVEREDSIDIVDYKFSKLSAKILKEKYEEQLKLYKKAVELAYNKKVKNMYIYSIEKCELY